MEPIKVPSVGESIQEATILEWFKNTGDFVEANEVVVSLETDKASVEIISEHKGKLIQKAKMGETVKIGAVIAEVDTEAKKLSVSSQIKKEENTNKKTNPPLTTPSSRKLIKETHLEAQNIKPSGRRGHILKEDVFKHLNSPSSGATPLKTETPPPPPSAPSSTLVLSENVSRKTMSPLRKTLAKRLVQSQKQTASLTTFNEVDMSFIFNLRNKYKESFQKKYGFKLGFMGFFIKASVEALKTFPEVNAFIEDEERVYHHYYHVGVAVSTDKGLVVPVIRHADKLSLPEVEQSLQHYVGKARNGQLSLNDLSGGTFTVSNGGVFGSLMSTPILNPPQSGILGMHKIEQRPVVRDGKIEIKPMMYIALTYDHRMIDGRDSVGFLLRIKECIEDPSRILIEV